VWSRLDIARSARTPLGLLTLLACVAIGSAAAAPDAFWSQLPAYPIAISNNAVTSVRHADDSTTIYSFMGIRNPTARRTITAASYKLTIPGGDWQRIADAPLLDGLAKIGASAVTIAGRVYLVGGYAVRPDGREVTEPKLYRYEPTGDRYVDLGPVSSEVDDTVAAVYRDRYLVLISGWHGPLNRSIRRVQFYDTVDGVWLRATQIPGPRPGLFGHAGGIAGDEILYLDGASNGTNFPISNRVFAGRITLADGDQPTIDWRELAAHPGSPTYRAANSLSPTFGGHLLIVGGTDNTYNFNGSGYDGEPSQPLDQVLVYDPNASTWAAVSTFGEHQATMDHRGLVRVGRGWSTVGGMIAPGLATDRVYRLTLRSERSQGDVDLDDDVDLSDVALQLSAFIVFSRDDTLDPRADLNGDDRIDLDDIEILLEHYAAGL